MARIISLDYGGFFYGTLDQFKDTFFSNATEELAMDFATEQNSVFHAFDGEFVDFSGLSDISAQVAVNSQIAASADKNMVTNVPKKKDGELTEAAERVRKATLAAIGYRKMSEDDVLTTVQGISRVSGYIHGIDTSLTDIADGIIAHNIPDQIIE